MVRVKGNTLKCFLPLLMAVAVSWCSSILVDAGLRPANHGQHFNKQRTRMEGRVPGIMAWMDSLYEIGAMRDTFVIRDGYRLHSCYSAAPQQSAKTAVIAHGYQANPVNMMMIARMFRDSLGYNVWLPSMRYHGHSSGQAAQFGWKDRLDLLFWSEMAHTHFNDTLQVFHGISMGGAAVMMASGEETKPYVRGFIEDCGFSELTGEIRYLFDERYRVHLDRYIPKASAITEKRYGWSFEDASSVAQLRKCTKPMLFIHGGADDFVPTRMVGENYMAKEQGYRELWIAPGSRHAMSYPEHQAEYTEIVRTFLKEHVE